MYRIDHIAVRLQRNADSLMLLAGIRDLEMDARPTTLVNVIRAGLGQIEGYQRVSLRSETEATVAPDIVDDLTLMLAELLENAVSFSPSDTPVEVVVRPGTDVTSDGGALIEVIDHGLGMSAERLDEENSRLVRRERLDLVPTKVLGLFVVGNLARRSGIRVTLCRTPGGGVTGSVWLPSALLLTESPAATASPAADVAGTAAVVPSRTVAEDVAGTDTEAEDAAGTEDVAEAASEQPAAPEPASTGPAPGRSGPDRAPAPASAAAPAGADARRPARTAARRPRAPRRAPRRLPTRPDTERTAPRASRARHRPAGRCDGGCGSDARHDRPGGRPRGTGRAPPRRRRGGPL
ncbi:ATP-binding protein [Streptomyces lydicus]|nr:ATP-binding protein [Streptomyces lydicus]